MESEKFNQHNNEEGEDFSENTEDIFTEDMMIKAEVLQRILPDIEELPAIRRQIFKMIYIEKLSIFEVASVLEISVDTVRVQKARTLHTLRDSLCKKHNNP